MQGGAVWEVEVELSETLNSLNGRGEETLSSGESLVFQDT